jgi:hypothetical protein
MKIITSNPVVTTSQMSNIAGDEFYEARGRGKGKRFKRGLKKAVGYIPAVAVGKAISDGFSNADDDYSNLPGGAFANPGSKLFQDAQNFNKSQNEKGLTWDKVKGAWTKAQESGVVDKVKGVVGSLFGIGEDSKPRGSVPISKRPPTKTKGMTTTTKVLIGVGVAAVIGFVIYKVASNKSN